MSIQQILPALFLGESPLCMDESDPPVNFDESDLKVKYPLYRHFETIPERNAVNDDNLQNEFAEPTPSPSKDKVAKEQDDAPTTMAPNSAPVPTLSPTLDIVVPSLCDIDENGNVNADPLAEESLVGYKYKITTEVSLDVLEDEVIPFLEHSLLQMIIGDVMDCETAAVRLLSGVSNENKSFVKRSRRLSLIGASSNPPDELSSEACLEEDCHFIDGSMTLYTEGSPGNATDAVGNLICDAFDGPSLLDTHEAILGLECIYPSDISGVPREDNNEIDTKIGALSPKRSSYAMPLAVLAAMAAVSLIFGIYAFRRGRNDDENESPIVHSNENEGDEEESPPGYERQENEGGSQQDDLSLNSAEISGDNLLSRQPVFIFPTENFQDSDEEGSEDENLLDRMPIDPLRMCIVSRNVCE